MRCGKVERQRQWLARPDRRASGQIDADQLHASLKLSIDHAVGRERRLHWGWHAIGRVKWIDLRQRQPEAEDHNCRMEPCVPAHGQPGLPTHNQEQRKGWRSRQQQAALFAKVYGTRPIKHAQRKDAKPAECHQHDQTIMRVTAQAGPPGPDQQSQPADEHKALRRGQISGRRNDTDKDAPVGSDQPGDKF